MAPSLSFQKTSGSGDVGTFRVGESWSIRISGPANTQVWFEGGQVGNQGPPSLVGVTDASGAFTMAGTMTAEQIGSWQERWALYAAPSMGGMSVGTVSFQVVPVPAAPSASPSQPSTTPSPTPRPGTIPSTGYLSPSTVNALTESNGIDVAGYHVPWWALAGAAGLLVVMFTGRR